MRQNVIQYGKNAFFDLTGIGAAPDDNYFFSKVYNREIPLPGAVGSRIGQELRSLNNYRKNMLQANRLDQGSVVITLMFTR